MLAYPEVRFVLDIGSFALLKFVILELPLPNLTFGSLITLLRGGVLLCGNELSTALDQVRGEKWEREESRGLLLVLDRLTDVEKSVYFRRISSCWSETSPPDRTPSPTGQSPRRLWFPTRHLPEL